MQDCNVIAKGSYSQFRFNEFISVRQYLLIREQGKKYLLLKLSNDAVETVTGIKLVVEQIDVRGLCIEKTHVEWTDVNGKPGEKFVAKDKIPLRENCMEVKIHLVGATYGEYTYAVKSNELVVTYDKKEQENTKDYSSYTHGKKSVAFARKFKLPYLLSILSTAALACVFVFTMSQLSSFKEKETAFRWNDVRYEFINGNKEEGSSLRIVEYVGKQANIVIPKEIEGHPVTEIEQGVFFNKDRLRTIDIRAEIVLGNQAFANCDNLEEVKLTGVTKVEERAFERCGSLRSVVANNLQEIGVYAFSECYALSDLEISHEEKELTIGKNAFYNCGGLKNITLDQIAYFPDAMFENASGVETLYLRHYNSALYETETDKTLAKMFGDNTLYNLRTLTIKDIDDLAQSFCADFYSLESVVLEGFAGDSVPYKAFYGCNNLEKFSVSFEEEGKNFTEVADYAFYQTRIPDFDGSALERIGSYAFAGNFVLTSVNLGENDSLCEFGRASFKDCVSLKNMRVASSITNLPESVFENCSSLSTVVFSESGKLKDIHSRALYGCESIQYISIPNSVVNIGDSAFEHCRNATTCIISQNIEKIGDSAFASCQSLKAVEVPKTVKNIGVGAFYDCTSLAELTVPFVGCSQEQQPYLTAIFGGSSPYDNYAVPESLKQITVTGDADIQANAFYQLTNIKRVYLNGGVSYIGEEAFAECSALREIHLSSALASISDSAFRNCYLLFEVWNNSELNIQLGEKNMGGVALYALAVYSPGDERLGYVEKNGFTFLCAETGWYVTDHISEETDWLLPESFTDENLIQVKEYKMPDRLFAQRSDVETLAIEGGVSDISAYAFQSCYNLKEVTALGADGLQNIAKDAFSDCTNLKKVKLPSGLQTIGEYAFYGCTVMSSIDMPEGLLELGDYAFGYCKKLTRLTIGNSVQRIGKGALQDTDSLQSLTVPFIGETPKKNQYMGYLFGKESGTGLDRNCALSSITVELPCTVEENAFYNFQSLRSVCFNGDVDKIGASAFANCAYLESVELTGTVRVIENNAFWCSGLQSIALHYGLESIGERAFYSTQLSEIRLPESLYNLGREAFAYSALKKVDMRNTALSEIPEWTFFGCYNLQTVDAEGSKILNIGANAFSFSLLVDFQFPSTLQTIGNNAFSSTYLKEVYLQGKLNTIGQSAFENCKELTSVSFDAENLSLISDYAFTGCSSLSKITFGGAIREIGSYAFQNCLITELYLPWSVQRIGCGAFENCYNLVCVWLSGELQSIEDYAFASCPNICEVYNPSSLSIKRGSYEYGYVAVNALIVHESLYAERMRTETVNGLIYKCAPTEGIACIYGYEYLPETLAFNTLNLGGVEYTYYWIYNSAFSSNDTLKELDTGVVNEIGQGAFAYSYSLRKVTLGEALEKGMVADDAFAQCSRLWEVQNHSSYNVISGGGDCGQVGYYALAVNESITYQESGKFKFFCYLDNWYLYEYSGNGKDKLPNINANYSLFKHPMLGEYPFQSVYYSYLIIPTYVTGASDGVFGWYPMTIYYEGVEMAWNDKFSNISKDNLTLYYYSDCVHNSYYGTNYWRYNTNNVPTTRDSDLREHVTPATCKEEGLREWICDVCGDSLQKETLPIISHTINETVQDATCKEEGLVQWTCDYCGEVLLQNTLEKVAHNYGNQDGSCIWCNQKRVEEDGLGKFVTVSNPAEIGFMVKQTEDGNILYSDWQDNYGSFETSLEITATSRVVVKFTCEAVIASGSLMKICVNGEEYLQWKEDNDKQIELELKEGDTLTFILQYAEGEEPKETRLTLSGITIKELASAEE